MKVAFVIPKYDGRDSALYPSTHCKVFPPIGLARMAGLVGKHGAVHLIDERTNSVQHETQANIAVIFINNYNFQRAYSLADYYHNRGSFVVFTGPRLSHAPNEACKYADCLFIGSGTDCMSNFLTDYMSGTTRRLYGGQINKAVSGSLTMMNGNTALSLV
jgi:hypothetical protein